MHLLYHLLILSIWTPLLLAERLTPKVKAKLVEEARRSRSHQAAIGDPIKMFDTQLRLVRRANSKAVNEYPLTYSDELHDCMVRNCYPRVKAIREPSYKCDEVIADYFLFGDIAKGYGSLLNQLSSMCIKSAKYYTEEVKRQIEKYKITPDGRSVATEEERSGRGNPLHGVIRGIKRVLSGGDTDQYESRMGDVPSSMPPARGGQMFKFRRPRR